MAVINFRGVRKKSDKTANERERIRHTWDQRTAKAGLSVYHHRAGTIFNNRSVSFDMPGNAASVRRFFGFKNKVSRQGNIVYLRQFSATGRKADSLSCRHIRFSVNR